MSRKLNTEIFNLQSQNEALKNIIVELKAEIFKLQDEAILLKTTQSTLTFEDRDVRNILTTLKERVLSEISSIEYNIQGYCDVALNELEELGIEEEEEEEYDLDEDGDGDD